MNIHSIRALPGPNIYCHRPMLAMELDLGEFYAVESYEWPGFIDRLLALLPGLRDHFCASGCAGGFVKRLREGTYAGHIVEHVALELTDAVGISTTRGKTVATDIPGRYLVTVEYKCEPAMKYLLETAVELVEALIRNEPYPLEARLQQARDVAAKDAFGPSTQAIVDAAARRGIPWARVNHDSRVRFGTGRAIRYIQGTVTDRTSVIAVELAGNKHETKHVLATVGLPVPKGRVVTSRHDALASLAETPFPVVVKPMDGNQGRGVSLNLVTAEQVGEAFELAAAVSPRVIVEEMFRGNDYRVVVVGGRMVAAAQRIPAHVWGDGRHTIRELIDLANTDPRRGDDHEKPLTKIHTDPLVLAILKRQGRAIEDVAAAGEMVLLRESANLSTGGEARDVTDSVHPTVRSLCERAARVIGLDICGVDLVLPTIDQPFTAGGIVEINAAPGIRMHHFPSEGTPRDVGGAIIDMIYPPGAPTHIPIVAITGTNGKTTVTRMIEHALSRAGYRTGMTTTDGIWIGGETIAEGDLTGPWSANVVLADPSVDIAVLETARGGIMRGGLAFDWADVAVITNIAADHLGQDGIDDVDDLLRVKRLVAERVREGGALVLNADDARVSRLAVDPKVTPVPRQIVYFSLDPQNETISYHLGRGGTAFVVDGEWIVERRDTAATRMIRTADVPATIGGTAHFQIANALAAAAAARACGMSVEAVAEALVSFDPTRHGAGRLNVFAINGGYAVVDYGHNPAAIRALCEAARHWEASRLTAVLGVPGDRRDDLVCEAARAVFGVDRVIVKEDDDPRGRSRGTVARILAGVLRQEAPALPFDVVLGENEAIAAALERMQPGEVVLLFCERPDVAAALVTERGGMPAGADVASMRQPAA